MPAIAEPSAPVISSAQDYEKLTRQQRLALFLIVIGPESASEVMRQFGDAEVEVLCREMSLFPMVSDAVRSRVFEEFAPIIGDSVISSLGGFDYARQTLEKARGDHRAGAILSRVGGTPGGNTDEIIREFAEMEGRQIFNLVKNEQPQTIAFLLSYLGNPKAAEVFGFFEPVIREEIAERLGTLDSTSLDLVGKIVNNLGRHIDARARPSFHQSGGIRAVADLLNGLDKESSKTLILRLEERNAPLGAAVRKKMFSFEDLIRLQAADLQRVLREVDSANLGVSMKTASEAIKEKIYGAISKRAAESLREEVGMLGRLRAKEIDAAQDSIIQVVRRLEDEGVISLDDSAEGAA